MAEGGGSPDPGDARTHPDLYRVGRGEQGVFLVQPYKQELLPLWRFRTPEVARQSAADLRARFDAYLDSDDLIGADMARKYLQMGYTRARRYANHAGGRKYEGAVPADRRGVSGAHGRAERPRDPEDPVKAESARIFKAAWDEVESIERYTTWRAAHRKQFG